MKPKELEILPCYCCGQIPEFLPWPTQEFPVNFNPVCADPQCRNGVSFFTKYSKLKKAKRRASLNTAIRFWNNRVLKKLKGDTNYSDKYVTCKYCKCPGLTWGKRSYKSAWIKKPFDFVLYEKVESKTKTRINLHGSSINWKFKPHNCLSTKNIVSVTHSSEHIE